MEDKLAGVIEALRLDLIANVDHAEMSLLDFTEKAISFWKEALRVDRIFICDMKNGQVIAGWQKGKNIARLSDWDPNYVPLEDDQTLQRALEGDELIASPSPGEGGDLAFSIPMREGNVWLVVFDETNVAREFTPFEHSLMRLVRDLISLKIRKATR